MTDIIENIIGWFIDKLEDLELYLMERGWDGYSCPICGKRLPDPEEQIVHNDFHSLVR